MRPRSLRTQLTILSFAVTLVALLAVLFYVTPQLRVLAARPEAARARRDGARLHAADRRASCAATADDDEIDNIVSTVSRPHERARHAAARRRRHRGPAARDLLGLLHRQPRSPTCASRSPTRAARTRPHDVGGELLAARASSARSRCRSATTGTVSRVAVFSAPMADVQGNVALIRRQILIAGALGLLLALAGGFVVSRSMARRVRVLERGAGQVAARRLHRGLPGRQGRRARPARARAGRHAAPARPAGERAAALHRDGVARAAHADLLDRRLPGAHGGRGARRRDAAPVRRHRARAGRAPGQARDRPARPLAPGGRLAGAAPRARPTSAR